MEWIESIDDPRLAAYRNLPDRALRGESIFVTEGELLTVRLLESDFSAESVFASEQFAHKIEHLVGENVPLYVAPERLMLEVVGFKFHRGVLGAGRRGPSLEFDELMARKELGDRFSLIVCPEVTNPENLGLIFRSAGGFGVDGVLLGERCCDPLSRRCLRLSMGATLRVPFVKSPDLAADVGRLKETWQIELLAAVLDDRAERLSEIRWPARAALVFGSEFGGIRRRWLSLCDRLVTIPMQPGTDSLNLGVAAGIFLYEMAQGSPTSRREG